MHCPHMSNSQHHYKENGTGDSGTRAEEEKLGKTFRGFQL